MQESDPTAHGLFLCVSVLASDVCMTVKDVYRHAGSMCMHVAVCM